MKLREFPRSSSTVSSFATTADTRFINPSGKCAFSQEQNVVKDPPFSNLDMISCRNLLIYFGPILQKRAIPTFYYALKPRGFLMLGPSESLGSFEDLFTLIDKKHKIYQKKRSAARLAAHFIGPEYHGPAACSRPTLQKSWKPGFDVDREVERLLAQRFVPGSIVVNQRNGNRAIPRKGRTLSGARDRPSDVQSLENGPRGSPGGPSRRPDPGKKRKQAGAKGGPAHRVQRRARAISIWK